MTLKAPNALKKQMCLVMQSIDHSTFKRKTHDKHERCKIILNLFQENVLVLDKETGLVS